MMRATLGGMSKALNETPFNLVFHFAPEKKNSRQIHWHIEIYPQIHAWSGLERGFGVYVNNIRPEKGSRSVRFSMQKGACRPGRYHLGIDRAAIRMAKFETWVALGSLALGLMFVALIISFANLLTGPGGKGPQVFVDPIGVLVLNVSISGVPCLILAGVVFGLTRSNARRNSALILIITGIILIAGMYYSQDCIHTYQLIVCGARYGFSPSHFHYRWNRCGSSRRLSTKRFK